MQQSITEFRKYIQAADNFAAQQDDRAAASYYSAALRIAASLPNLPMEISADAQRAQQKCTEYAQRFESHVLANLHKEGESKALGARFQQSLDILFGRKQIYPQSPHIYYFPELPQIQFYDRKDFDWAARLEGETAAIKEEALQALATKAAFKPYLVAEENRPQNEHHQMVNNDDWGAFYLYKDGKTVEENAAQCPATMQALQALPPDTLTSIDGRAPNILFSLLRPGAKIPAHTGLINARLICHLPLLVPEGCGFRVGNDTRTWHEGELMLFDDTIEHEAWNNSNEPRLILLFEIWRPELADDEKRLVASLLEAVDAYNAP